MQPNIIERVWRQDKMVNVDVLNGFTFTDEEEAHRFIISGKNVNTPVDISGTITANFKNADGVLVPLTGTVEDGKAVVVLSRECYAVEGPFSLMIFADTVCIYAAIANVINSSGEVIAYPTATIPNIRELIEEAQDVIASIPQDYSTLNQSVQDLKSASEKLSDNTLSTVEIPVYVNAVGYQVYNHSSVVASWAPNGVVSSYWLTIGKKYRLKHNRATPIYLHFGNINQQGGSTSASTHYLYVNPNIWYYFTAEEQFAFFTAKIEASDTMPTVYVEEISADTAFTKGDGTESVSLSFTTGKCIIAAQDNQYYGQEVASEQCSCTGYIPVSRYKKIRIPIARRTTAHNIGLVFYDDNYTALAGKRYQYYPTNSNGYYEYDIEPTYAYVRTCVQNAETYETTMLGLVDLEKLKKSAYEADGEGWVIRIAAHDAFENEKLAADYVCDGVNDEEEIRNAINWYPTNRNTKSKTVLLSTGHFNFDAFEDTYHSCCRVSPYGSMHIKVKGVTNRGSVRTTINITSSALTGLGNNDGFVFGCASNTTNLTLDYEDFAVILADNQHSVCVIDNSRNDSGTLKNLTLFAVPSNIAGTESTPMPGTKCIGIRAWCGDDSGIRNMMQNIFVTGFYEGFQLGAEHVICMNCVARYNYYSFTFGRYSYHVGTCSHSIALIQCADEHSRCLPYFGNNGLYNSSSSQAKQAVYFIAYNIELFAPSNFIASGESNYVIPAEEKVSNTWRGRIDFTGYGTPNISGGRPGDDATQNLVSIKFWKDGQGHGFRTTNMAHLQRGLTAERETYVPTYMQEFFDMDLNKLLICTNPDTPVWVDCNGNEIA